MKRSCMLLVAATVVALLPALAGEGRIPVYQQVAIDAPGAYVVTRDVHVASGYAILISSDDVVLDLNGFTVSSADPTASVLDIQLSTSETGVVRIRDGRLVGGRYGIFASSAKQIFIEGVEIRDSGLHAIELNPTRYFEVSRCTIVSPGTRGLNAYGGGQSISGRVVDNTISGSPDIGILLSDFNGGEVSGNQLELTGGPTTGIGIQEPSGPGRWGNLVARNRIRHDGTTGLSLTGDPGGDLVVENIVRYQGTEVSTSAGISVSTSGTVCRGNVVSGHQYGVEVFGDGNHFEENRLFDNDYGLYFAAGTDNSYRGNVLVGNNTAAVDGAALGDSIDGGGNLP